MSVQQLSQRSGEKSLVSAFVFFFERVLPDAFALAIGITILVVVASYLLSPHGDIETIVSSWYSGMFGIVGFAFQVLLILITGHALAHAPIVQRGLQAMVSKVRTPTQAAVVTFLVSAIASWLSWGFGLVVGAVLAREVAKRIRVDFGWLIAVAYSGWVIWASGPSNAISLSLATHGSALNFAEKATGHVLPLSTTVFALFNMVPTLLVVAIVPFFLVYFRPRDDEAVLHVPVNVNSHTDHARADASFARTMNQSPALSIFLVVMAAGYFVLMSWKHGTVPLDMNGVILILFAVGVALHRNPVAYAAAVNDAAQQSGSIILQFPIYGGIMGIIQATGLAAQASAFFVSISTTHTLPFWTYCASLVVTFLVPSGGGHWVIQGPLAVPAAVALHASVPATTMAVAMGEQVSNMLQPFWALPVVAMAGIGIQRVLGYTAITFLVAVVIYGASLLLLV